MLLAAPKVGNCKVNAYTRKFSGNSKDHLSENLVLVHACGPVHRWTC